MSASVGDQPRPGNFHVPQVQRILPGPAGKLQQLAAAGALDQATPEALGLRECGGSNTTVNHCLHDPCFQSAVWNNAQGYVAQQQAAHGPTGQLHTVRMAKELSLGKVAKMLVLLGSFQPSGAGSAFCKVKDPTGSIGAALHSSTLKQQPQLGPGCILLLQNVSVFTPAPATSYLAITAHNIVKVWEAESSQDRIRNSLHRSQHEQQQQQPPLSVASQQGSQQVAAATLSGNGSCLLQHQQRSVLAQVHRGMNQQQQDSTNTQQQQQCPRQTQLPPPSPHLPGLIDRSAGRAAVQGQQQQQQQQSSSQRQQQHNVMQQGHCSPAVTIDRGPAVQLNAAGAADSSSGGIAGFAGRLQHQQSVPGMSPAVTTAGNGGMPPPPPRIQPSSFRGQLQQRQTKQLQQPRFGAFNPQQQQMQQGVCPVGSAAGSGGSCGSMSGGQAGVGWQQQQDCLQIPPAMLGNSAPRTAGRTSVQQQQQQQHACMSLSQQLDSQSVPPALLGAMPGSAARNTPHVGKTPAQGQQKQQQCLQTVRLPAAGMGQASHDLAMDVDGVDDVVAAIFGSQLCSAPAAAGPPPTPAAAPAVFGKLVGTMQTPAAKSAPPAAARSTGWPQHQQQQEQHLQSNTVMPTPASNATARSTPSSSVQSPSQKRFKTSSSIAGAAVSGAVLPNPSSGSQQGSRAAGRQQQHQLEQQQREQAHPGGGDDCELFGGLLGFQPSLQQQQLEHGISRIAYAQTGSAKLPTAGRPFTSAIGRPPMKQANLLDDLLGDELDDFDM